VSRGELVEIGGSFRIPEVMAASGAIMKEVGTTNRTHLRDYADAVTDETALLMKVHRSNYRIEGFTAEVPMRGISRLARERGLVDYYDLGSAHMGDLPWDLERREPSLPEILERHRPSLVSFSGDKLFGGVQAGIVAGKKALIDRLKRNQALRMLRVDKLTLALIERTALAYLRGQSDRIPALALLRTPMQTLRKRARRLAEAMPMPVTIAEGEGLVGGGTLPGATVPTVLLRVEGDAERLAGHFRAHRVIGRVEADTFVLDMRTLFERDIPLVAGAAAAWTA
jgi:L-seryl-tRNA(Ser) seleniumtransferase